MSAAPAPTPIWYEDLAAFMSIDNYYIILPAANMSLEEKLNAIVRFFIYLGVFLAIVRADYRFLFFGIIAALLSVILYNKERQDKRKAEKFLQERNMAIVDNKVCTQSTVENPFMNPSVFEIGANPQRPEACPLAAPGVAETVETNFNERLFQDVSDLYGKYASQRQYYTVPSTTIPNDQGSFAEWCYGSGPTCKERGGGAACYRNRYRHIGYQ